MVYSEYNVPLINENIFSGNRAMYGAAIYEKGAF